MYEVFICLGKTRSLKLSKLPCWLLTEDSSYAGSAGKDRRLQDFQPCQMEISWS